MVTAAQTTKAPFIRLADRYALLLLPVTLVLAGAAWFLSGDAIRGLAVLVAATPCPLILAAPAAFIAGVSQAARRGILIKGGGPLEALANTHTVLFDKTGTLTVGGARLVAVEAAPGESADEVLRLAGSLEQASQHVVAKAIVAAAVAKGLPLEMPSQVHETMGSGVEGRIGGRDVMAGSHQLVYGSRRPEDWAVRTLRRAAWRSALSVFVSVDGRAIGALLLGDELRRETPRAVQALRNAGVERIVMVDGSVSTRDAVLLSPALPRSHDVGVCADGEPAHRHVAARRSHSERTHLRPTLDIGNTDPDLQPGSRCRSVDCGSICFLALCTGILPTDELDRSASLPDTGVRTSAQPPQHLSFRPRAPIAPIFANLLFDNIWPLVYLPWQTRSRRTIDPRQRFQRRDPRY